MPQSEGIKDAITDVVVRALPDLGTPNGAKARAQLVSDIHEQIILPILDNTQAVELMIRASQLRKDLRLQEERARLAMHLGAIDELIAKGNGKCHTSPKPVSSAGKRGTKLRGNSSGLSAT